MNKMDEMIIVAPRTEVFENETITFQGVTFDQNVIDRVTSNINYSMFVHRRGDAEEDESLKQPIPYVVIRRGDEVYAYKRLSGGGESRLHDQVSLGAGGHANKSGSLTFNEEVLVNAERELEEELDIKGQKDGLSFIGLINDDENEVGKYHIGVLAVLDIAPEATVEVKEVDQLEGFWANIKDLKNEELYNSLESWSKYVADVLNK